MHSEVDAEFPFALLLYNLRLSFVLLLHLLQVFFSTSLLYFFSDFCCLVCLIFRKISFVFFAGFEKSTVKSVIWKFVFFLPYRRTGSNVGLHARFILLNF